MISFTATYSPEDNKLRLYASARLDADLYTRVKRAGFTWAPKQELFVAPMWTPAREDLCIELAGDLDDEDRTLVDRAKERADRFDGYRDNRLADADTARRGVKQIADNIPFGQPILVGHHSERHARRDQARIESGMRRAVQMWDTADYWKQRAAAALCHAKYKELPTVRARRIKKLEADLRKCQRNKVESERKLQAWAPTTLTIEQARKLANASYMIIKEANGLRWSAWDVMRPDDDRSPLCPAMTVDQVRDHVNKVHGGYLPFIARWIQHYENRLTYERAMLEEQGATALLAPKPRRALPPLRNYRAAGKSITARSPYDRTRTITYTQVDMTRAEYAAIHTDYRGCRWSTAGSHRFRTAIRPGLSRDLVAVFLTDSAEHPAPSIDAPAPIVEEQPTPWPAPPCAAPIRATAPAPALAPADTSAEPGRDEFETMRQQLRAGVQIVAVPQLFVTAPDLAARMVAAAEIERIHRVLEPSAGTGALMMAIGDGRDLAGAEAVELNQQLANALHTRFPYWTVNACSFLDCTVDSLGTFDRILMNPPFERGSDIDHIEHAATLLRSGGRIVAICAHGPVQRRRLMPLCARNDGVWEDLPAGSFKHAGTMVNTAMLIING